MDTTKMNQFFGPKDVQDNPFLWSDWSLIFWLSVLLLLLLGAATYLYIRLHDNKPLIKSFKLVKRLLPHQKAMKEIADNVKNAAYEIIEKKQATYYGIAMSVRRICEAVIRDEKSILPISRMLHGEYGIDGVALSLPAIVGAGGVETPVPAELNEEELSALKRSGETLKAILDENL